MYCYNSYVYIYVYNNTNIGMSIPLKHVLTICKGK